MPMPSYYVYAYLRQHASAHPAGSPYYVGKGRGRRAFISHRQGGRGIQLPQDRRFIIVVADGLTEAEAFALEIALIWWYGRVDRGTGCLHNKTDGGDGGSGRITSADTRLKLKRHKRSFFADADNLAEYRAVMRQCHADTEYRRRQSETRQRLWADPEYRDKSLAASHALWGDPEHRRKQSDGVRAWWARRRKEDTNG